MRPERHICVVMKDNTPRRVALKQAETLLSEGSARRYISRSIYKALMLGITVKDFNIKGNYLRDQIKAANAKLQKIKVSEKKSQGSEEPESSLESQVESVADASAKTATKSDFDKAAYKAKKQNKKQTKNK